MGGLLPGSGGSGLTKILVSDTDISPTSSGEVPEELINASHQDDADPELGIKTSIGGTPYKRKGMKLTFQV
jgi:hypothetical protein